MSDVVVTVPKGRWDEWLAEGELPDDPLIECELCGDRLTLDEYEGHRLSEGYDDIRPEWAFYLASMPSIRPGERVYIVAHGRLRGYAPLVRVDPNGVGAAGALIRHGGGVALTIHEPIRGFQGWRYRWWEYESEVPFPDWRTAGVS